MRSHLTSIKKAISWRLIAVTITAITAYYVTDSITVSLSIASVDTIVKLFAYYIHERLWIK